MSRSVTPPWGFRRGYGRATGQVLVEQYRMPPAICELVSDCFYSRHHVTLEPSSERKGDDRFAAPGVPRVLADEILWVDTSGEPDSAERRANHNRDSWNEAEVEAILRILQKIHDDAVFNTALCRDEDPPIGVICMYKRQKRRIEQAFADRPFPDAFAPRPRPLGRRPWLEISVGWTSCGCRRLT